MKILVEKNDKIMTDEKNDVDKKLSEIKLKSDELYEKQIELEKKEEELKNKKIQIECTIPIPDIDFKGDLLTELKEICEKTKKEFDVQIKNFL